MASAEFRIRDGIKNGLPVFIGYFPMAMAFGLLAKAGNIDFSATVAFSVLVFAGASQFMAINLLAAGVAAGEIVLATFLLNFRHFLMSASLAPAIKKGRRIWVMPLVAFGVTDETFSVAATMPEKPNIRFLVGLEVISYSGWVGGTIAGYLVGSSLPLSVQASMGITLYAMFTAILIPQFKKSVKIVFLALGSGAIHAFLLQTKMLPAGWSIITAMVLTALLGAAIFKERETEP
ncbi:MAG: AzlC family ABC transporter permease [Bacillota bacterium]